MDVGEKFFYYDFIEFTMIFISWFVFITIIIFNKKKMNGGGD